MFLALSLLVTLCSSQASLPVPGTTGLVPGSAAEAQWYQQQQLWYQTQLAAMAPGRRKRSPLPPIICNILPDFIKILYSDCA